MKKDPDIVKILKKEEKLGLLKTSNNGKNKKFQNRFQKENNIKNACSNKTNNAFNDYYLNRNQSPNDKKIFSDLLEIINFTETISTCLYGDFTKNEIITIIINEFKKSKKYTGSILLLSEDRKKLHITGTSSDKEKFRKAEKLSGYKIKNFTISLEKSQIYSKVVYEGKTVHFKIIDLLEEIFPKQFAFVVSKLITLDKNIHVATPLKLDGKIIGAFAMSSTMLADLFIPSVKNLALHISNALQQAKFFVERKQEEIQLSESEQLYRNMIERSPLGIFTVSTKGVVTSCNESFVQMAGFSKNELVGKNIANYPTLIKKEIPKYMNKFFSMVKGNLPEPFEFNWIRKDGTHCTGEMHIGLIKTPENITGIQGIIRDITESKKTTEKLQDAEERYNALFKSSLDLVYLCDFKGHFLDANNAALTTLGYAKDEIKSLSFTDLLDSKQILRAINVVREIKKFGYQKNIKEFKLKRKNGEYLFIETMGTLIYREGKPFAVQGIARDITDRKLNQIKLQNRTEDLELINLVNNAINSNKKLEKIFSIISKGTGEIFNSHNATIYQISNDKKFLIMKQAGLTKKNKKNIEKIIGINLSNFKIPLKKGTIFYEIISENKPRLLNTKKEIIQMLKDASDNKILQKLAPTIVKILKLKSTMLVPLFSNKECIGIIDISREYSFTNSELDRFENIAKQLIVAIDRILLKESKKFSEDKYRHLYEKLRDGSAAVDMNGKIVEFNSAFLHMLGYTADEICTLTYHDITPKKWHQIEEKIIQEQVLKQGFSDLYEKEYIRKDGTIIPVELTTYLLRNKNKDPVGMWAIVREITDRKKAELELKESREYFQTLFNTMIDPVAIVDSKGKILELTDKIYELTGFERNELIGKNFLLTKIASAKTKAMLLENLVKRMEGKKIPPYEVEILTKDKRKIQFEINAARINYFGKKANMVVFRDISERKFAENSLKESEEKFRNLAEQSPNMIFIYRNGKIAYANKKCEELMGYSKEEFYSSDFNFLTLIEPDYKNDIKDNLKKHMIGEDVPSYEYVLITKAGKKIEAIITLKLIKYAGKNAILGIITDITDWKKAENELRESEEKFKNIANRSSDAIVVTNEKGIIDYISPSVEKISGYTPSECIGRSFFSFLYKKEIPKVTKQFYQTIKNNKDIDNFPIKIKGKHGETIFAEISATPIVKNDKIIGTQGIIRDITGHMLSEQKLRVSEENYRNIVELAPDGIITVNTKGIITSCNPAFIELTGYSVEEIKDKHFTKLPTMRKRDIAKYLTLYGSLLRGKKQRTFQFEWIHKDGTIRIAEARASLLKQDNKVVGMQAILRDITNQKQAEKELHEAHEKLKSLNLDLEKKVEERTVEINKLLKQKDDFINQLGHDLKNPLNPIVNLLPIVEKKEQDSNSKEMLQIINRSANYMKNLVIKTIKLAQLNSSTTNFSFEDTNLLDIINEVLDKNKLIFDKNQLEINNSINKNIQVYVDRLRIDEVFDNLISNAIKYSPQGSRISIYAEENPNSVTISIEDTGIGMKKDKISYIFDEFYKADESRHDFDSSGLGLPICKRIIEKHNGRIWAESHGKGKGTKMSFTLPKLK
jgi:PAS domain S-box-containing protein